MITEMMMMMMMIIIIIAIIIMDCDLNVLLLIFVSFSEAQFLINKLPVLNQNLDSCQTDNKSYLCITTSKCLLKCPQ
jgi:hypothetical protein